jgi:L-threonylcarbamoyladenylate synthase
MSHILTPFHAQALRLAQSAIEQGKLIGFPTETVYALAADASNDEAVSRIYAAKKRQENKPLSLLVKDVAQIRELCEVNVQAEILLRAFAPGPLTLVLPLKEGHNLSRRVNPGMTTIGVRIPDHPIAQAVLHAMAVPLVGTSANLTGEAEALSAADMAQTLGDEVAVIIDGGKSQLGVASTVIEVTQTSLTILRQGSVTKEQLETVLYTQRKAI